MTDTMRIWRKVDQTDPRHTKKVSFGREFTSIDAHYQVMLATQQFGPVGEGWRYSCEYGFQSVPGLDKAGKPHEHPVVWCDLTLQWGPATEAGAFGRVFENSYGPIRGMCEVTDGKGRPDKDAAKKAMTDALTKALSHLGFNADVFLGKFDDNTYVQKMMRQFDDDLPECIKEYERRTKDARTLEELQAINTEMMTQMVEAKNTHAREVTAAAALWTRRKAELAPKET